MLGFGCLQTVRVLLTDVARVPNLIQTSAAVAQYHAETDAEAEQLQQEITRYSSPQGLEELARNNLEMVGPNETLVRFSKI